MSVAVNLWSGKEGDIKEFLDRFYQRDVFVEIDARHWICEYSNPLESVDLITAVIDNSDRFSIVLYIQVNNGDFHRVNEENCEDIIKGLFILFYDENNSMT